MDWNMLIRSQRERYPRAQTRDIIKALYQSMMGCGHLVKDGASALARLRSEAEGVTPDAALPLTEDLGEYARVWLSPYLAKGGRLETLAALFEHSARPESDEKRAQLVRTLTEASDRGLLDADEIQKYISEGCPAVHHSGPFSKAYAPAYRVIDSSLADLLELLIRIDCLRSEKPNAVIAIDGPCGSGKTTLAALLCRVTGARVIHMDDFFLRPQQRTPERFAKPGENVDHERFLEEVLLPLKNGKTVCYRPFDCGSMTVGEGETLAPEGLWIAEGSYSLHESLAPHYDLRILLEIAPEAQRQLLLRREGAEKFRMFETRWIPLENRYFTETAPAQRSDMVIRILPQDSGSHRYRISHGGKP